jgi:rhamnose transport system substrate-binding protein
MDADTEGFEDAREAFVQPADFGEIGKSQIELMGELIGYEGEFAILSATTDAPNQNAWIAGMKETLKDPKYARMKLAEIAYGNDDPQKSLTEAQALLTKHPSLKGILAPTSVGVVAAAQAVETAKAADRVSVTGLGTPDQMRRFVEEGIVRKFQLWDPADAGYLAGCLIVDLIEGKAKTEVGARFTAGRLGERAFKEKNVTIGGPLVTFDKSNIGNYRF